MEAGGRAGPGFSIRLRGALRADGLEDITGDGGVRKEVLRPSSGEPVPPDATVAVKYSGYLEDMEEPFCTYQTKGFPRLMKLGVDITLLGLEIGLLTMKKGEVARFIFTPNYAYGKQGCLPLIPKNATVLFIVELIDFIDSAESDVFFALAPEQRATFPLQKVLKVAKVEREFGNYLFRQQSFEGAKDRYKKAYSILSCSSSSEAEQHQIDASKLLVLLNLSVVYLKLERPAQALIYGKKALEIDEGSVKALFRCGQACLRMLEFEKARDFLVRAQHREPFNQEINDELKKLACCYKDYLNNEKERCFRMFAAFNSSSKQK
ncbi:inactive peptidyl-prolyl cis-trans isomerase FKBP6 [Cyrtonyx montezumae]|uniref:inactive peptidyl-prolyl cis-trans isomerase FKBP6 n=1 Tax=Cyrtonyx montezumae TaxID=9017 RepID=UPI0032DB1C27